jgi:hypothetical protein
MHRFSCRTGPPPGKRGTFGAMRLPCAEPSVGPEHGHRPPGDQAGGAPITACFATSRDCQIWRRLIHCRTPTELRLPARVLTAVTLYQAAGTCGCHFVPPHRRTPRSPGFRQHGHLRSAKPFRHCGWPCLLRRWPSAECSRSGTHARAGDCTPSHDTNWRPATAERAHSAAVMLPRRGADWEPLYTGTCGTVTHSGCPHALLQFFVQQSSRHLGHPCLSPAGFLSANRKPSEVCLDQRTYWGPLGRLRVPAWTSTPRPPAHGTLQSTAARAPHGPA